jgi:hypothetical protein
LGRACRRIGAQCRSKHGTLTVLEACEPEIKTLTLTLTLTLLPRILAFPGQ